MKRIAIGSLALVMLVLIIINLMPVNAVHISEAIENHPEPQVDQDQLNIVINNDEVVAMAKMAWGEARGCSDMEVAATMWVVLNRVDESGDSIIEVITAPYQFTGYNKRNPVEERFTDLAIDVMTRWQMEKQGASPSEVGRVLPQEYLFFHGDGVANHFRDKYRNGKIWDWSLPNPYDEMGEN